MVNTILICFKKSNILKKFDKKLSDDNIEFDKQANDDWYNYRFNDKNINTIQYYIIYFNLNIKNEEFFIKQYIRLHKNLTQEQRDKIFFDERKRFGK